MSAPVTFCSVDSDCPDGYICDGGVCVPAGGGGDPVDPLPGLGNYLQKRYTCNVAVTEQMSALDFLQDVVFVSSRLFFKQTSTGRLGIKNKKPVPYGFATAGITLHASSIALDNVRDWIGTSTTKIILAPHTDGSEVKTVTSATYSTGQNSVALSTSGGLFSVSGFSGCDGASTPATASITVTSASGSVACTITLHGITFEFTTTDSDTTESIASYIAGIIRSHPALWRQFSVSWTAGTSVVNLTARFGFLNVSPNVVRIHAAPLANPTTAPTVTASGSGSDLPAGTYNVAFSAFNANGETLLGKYKPVTITAGQNIVVSSVSLPAGATGIKWYVSPEAGSVKLRYVLSNTGGGFTVTLANLPKLSAQLPPDLNRTGAEVMRVSMVFTDRVDSRSNATVSNVLKATFSWLLGNRSKSINRIDLKYRDKTQDYRLIELRLRDDVHIDKVKKVLNEEVNGQAIDNTDQAYRIAAGLLAEKQDADFFYSWQSLREAMLLEEGDVVCCTDDGSGVYCVPVFIEQIDYEIDHNSMPVPKFTARKYSSRLFDDSVVETAIPIISEAAVAP